MSKGAPRFTSFPERSEVSADSRPWGLKKNAPILDHWPHCAFSLHKSGVQKFGCDLAKWHGGVEDPEDRA